MYNVVRGHVVVTIKTMTSETTERIKYLKKKTKYAGPDKYGFSFRYRKNHEIHIGQNEIRVAPLCMELRDHGTSRKPPVKA